MPEETARRDELKSFLGHLDELRKRILCVLLAAVLFSIPTYLFVDKVIAFLASQTGGFVFLRPAEAFLARFKISLIIGCFLAIPVAIYEVWRFVEIALKSTEKKILIRVLPASYLLFAVGTAFAWFIIIPVAVKFLLGFATENLKPFLSIDIYISFVAWITIGFGLMFQLPIVVVLLVWLGLVEPRTLAAYRRHVLLGIVIVSALMTPGPDIFSQLALCIPTYALFEISILISRAMRKPHPALPKGGRDQGKGG